MQRKYPNMQICSQALKLLTIFGYNMLDLVTIKTYNITSNCIMTVSALEKGFRSILNELLYQWPIKEGEKAISFWKKSVYCETIQTYLGEDMKISRKKFYANDMKCYIYLNAIIDWLFVKIFEIVPYVATKTEIDQQFITPKHVLNATKIFLSDILFTTLIKSS